MINPVVLIILDGWGLAPESPGNAVTLAKTPNFDRYWAAYPHTRLQASGEAVGLPPGEKGNSETGHLNIGAGRIIYQDLPRINMSIAEGTFFQIPTFLMAAKHAKTHNSALHLMGLISDAGVHSSLNHLFALLRFVKDQGLSNVSLHLFTDGRDSSPNSSMTYIKKIQEKIEELGVGQIASLIGRFYAMDRDNRWERTQKAYELLVSGEGQKFTSVSEAIEASYKAGKTDEFVEPIVLTQASGEPRGLIKDNDAVVFFNFRIDRPRQLTKAFVLPNFENLKIKKATFDPYAERYGLRQFEVPRGTTTFKRRKVLKNLFFVTMTEYEKGLPVETAFSPISVRMSLGRILSEKGLRQLHLAETEKFPHITYFFNGGQENKFPGEEQVLISSPKVNTYDEKPEMSAYEVTETLLKKLKENSHSFIVVNYANPDMVGHTGILEAGIKACEVTDECLGQVVQTTLSLDGTCLIIADHGNVEEMINLTTGEIDTEHSENLVPFVAIGKKLTTQGQVLPRGILADVAPTILGIMGINKPDLMTGRNLLQ